MRLLLLAAAAMIAAPSGAAPVKSPQAKAPASAICQRTTSYQAVFRNNSVQPQKLTELPPANLYAAVYRLVNGCEVPLVVRYNVGGRR
jgi:hypothetical protein